MIRTISIDILNEEALKKLKELEEKQLIRLKGKDAEPKRNRIADFKGAMSKQSPEEIDKQLEELRNSWQ